MESTEPTHTELLAYAAELADRLRAGGRVNSQDAYVMDQLIPGIGMAYVNVTDKRRRLMGLKRAKWRPGMESR